MSLCGKKNIFLNYVLIVFGCIVFLQGNAQQELSFLFAGDVMSHGPQIAAARNDLTDSYDYDAGFQFVKPIIEQHDIAIANLEVTHAGKPYSGYPQLIHYYGHHFLHYIMVPFHHQNNCHIYYFVIYK